VLLAHSHSTKDHGPKGRQPEEVELEVEVEGPNPKDRVSEALQQLGHNLVALR